MQKDFVQVNRSEIVRNSGWSHEIKGNAMHKGEKQVCKTVSSLNWKNTDFLSVSYS